MAVHVLEDAWSLEDGLPHVSQDVRVRRYGLGPSVAVAIGTRRPVLFPKRPDWWMVVAAAVYEYCGNGEWHATPIYVLLAVLRSRVGIRPHTTVMMMWLHRR